LPNGEERRDLGFGNEALDGIGHGWEKRYATSDPKQKRINQIARRIAFEG
jgi:hypothetical protein